MLLDSLKRARNAGVPLVAINTTDPASVVRMIGTELSSPDEPGGVSPVIRWDIARGHAHINSGEKNSDIVPESAGQESQMNPMAFTEAASRFPENTLSIMLGGDFVIKEPPVQQAIWNLRDPFKASGRMMIIVGSDITLPPALLHDVILFDDVLPDAEALTAIVKDLDAYASLCPVCAGDKVHKGIKCDACKGKGQSGRKTASKETLERSVEAIRGLAAFPAEQVVSMSCRKTGIDIDHLWEAKRKQIEQTPGLSVWRGGETFDDVGGLDNAKGFMQRLLHGRQRPNAVVFVDEIEKLLAGSNGAYSDSSGVSQGILQSLLIHMQDHDSAGSIFIGPPGAGKSMLAKSIGNEAGVPTIAFDSNAMKGSLVGQSEQNVRNALRVVSSVSNDQALWVATCNKLTSLPPELRRRFSLGTFFFDLPDATERDAIWQSYLGQYEHDADAERPDDEGWTGAEIKTACMLAYRLDQPLTEVAQYIVPVCRSAKDQIDTLRKEADGRFISATYPGVYSPTGPARKASRKRRVQAD